MSRLLQSDFKGMVTAPGLLERAEASCFEAINLLFEAPGVVRKRRGFEKQTGNAGGPVWAAFASRLMGNNVLCHVGTGTSGTQLRYGDGSGALTAVTMIGSSTLTRARETRAQMAVCQRNHYVTATEGVARIESSMTGATQRFAGMPRGMGPSIYANWWDGYSPISAGSNFGDGYARAYRVTWHLKDADGVELGGAPTGRAVLRNQSGIGGYAAGAATFTLRIPVPVEMGTLGTALTTSWFYRLWGTVTFNAAGSEQGNDEMYLLNEAYLSSSDITNGYATYTDTTPDSYLIKQPRRLHTNTQNFPDFELGVAQGTINEDAPPPIANAIAYWQDVMWYGDISYRHRLQVRLLAVSGSGLVNNDTVTVVGPTGVSVTLTGKTAGSASATEFTIFTGLATTQMNLEATASALVDAININAAATQGIRAYYVSVGNMTPGYIYLEATKTGSAPTFASSRAAAWSLLISGTATGVTDSQTNGLAFSKPYRADAVPPINLMAAGPADSRILKLHPLGDRLLVFTDYGIYEVVGRTFADFVIRPLDLGYKLMVRESVVTCDERVYAWCYEGIVEIDGAGVRVISTPIEPTIANQLLSAGTSPGAGGVSGGQEAFAALGFAVAYRYEHRVQFFFPEVNDSADLNGCAFWLNFDTRTRAWSFGALTSKAGGTYFDNRSCGVVRFADDRLVLGNWSSGADTFLFLERRAYAAADFTDDYQDGSSGAVTSTLSMQFQVPEPGGSVHFQQVVLSFDGGEYSWRPVPTALTCAWLTYPGGVGNSTTLATNTNLQWRTETPTTVRRGNRTRLRITHSTAEYFGLIGISQAVRVGSPFVGRAD